MTYDYMDRMSSVTINNRTTNYYYDHSKTRVIKQNPVTQAYTMYPNKYYEKSSDKDNRYVFLGNQRLGIVEKQTGQDPVLYLNFADHLNSSSVTTDSNGTITNLIDYFPYGTDRVNVQNGSYNPENKFTDQKEDTETSLYYYGARYYNDEVGRFTQSDPLQNYIVMNVKDKTGRELWQILMNPIALNAYAYSGDNPIRYVDPNGEWFVEWITGKQSTADFVVEIGQAGEALYQSSAVARWMMDHPYATGAIIGVSTGAIVAGVSVATSFSIVAAETTVTTIGFNVTKEYDKLNKAAQGAYDIAKSGGGNSGIITNISKNNMAISNIQKSIKSLQQLANRHLNYIKDPSTYEKYDEFVTKTVEQQQRTLNYWYEEAARYITESKVYEGVLNELIKK